MSTRTIRVDYLTRVEGEGALYIKIDDRAVRDVKLSIFEPPRFFEAFLKGRHFTEAPDITARICGICPVAYQMSSVHAMEQALGLRINGPLRTLRRLLYCGEWIESHTLHIIMLHAPDFLGYEDAIQMSRDHPQIVKQGLKIKKIGNQLVSLIGGREIHPINVKVGGFYKLPSRKQLNSLLEDLKWARDAAREIVLWTAQLPFPDFKQDYTFVALSHPDEYPFNEGRIISNSGLDIPPEDYEIHFTEEHVEHSNALQSSQYHSKPYFVGPLARYNLNYHKLAPIVQETAKECGYGPECTNPFQSIVIRALENLQALNEAVEIIDDYEPPEEAALNVEPSRGVGYGCTEAPRGILYHRYEIDDRGLIVNAKIVPPTSQNQKQIESDLHAFVTQHLDLNNEELTWKCEQVVRNYDPCISCATHFLDLKLDRS